MRAGLHFLSFRKPSHRELEDCAEQGGRAGPNHDLVGASEAFDGISLQKNKFTRVRKGWIEDYDALQVGKGLNVYERAQAAVREWKHMQLGWVDTNRPPIKPGSRVCIAAKLLCLWQRNPLEIIYVSEGKTKATDRSGQDSNLLQTQQQGRSFAFGQTTLKGHALAGEERFTVRWNKADDSVWYEVYAFSKADTLLAVATYPLRRYFQQKFRRDSATAVTAYVHSLGS